MFAEHEEGRKAGDIQSQMLEEKLEVNEAAVIGKPKYTFNRYRRKRPKVDASIFDSVLSHPRRSDPLEKKEKKIAWTFWPNSPVGKFRLLACIG